METVGRIKKQKIDSNILDAYGRAKQDPRRKFASFEGSRICVGLDPVGFSVRRRRRSTEISVVSRDERRTVRDRFGRFVACAWLRGCVFACASACIFLMHISAYFS